MKRNDIERRVNELVFDYYDYRDGTLLIEVSLTDAIIATVSKDFGSCPECTIYDEDIEDERSLPNLQVFIEKVTEQAIRDCVEQHEFEGYDDEAPVTLTRDELRWNNRRFNW